MRIAIFCGFVVIIAFQFAKHDYITASSIAALFILNEVILERAFNALNQKYRSAIDSLHDDNLLLGKQLRHLQLRIDAVNQRIKK